MNFCARTLISTTLLLLCVISCSATQTAVDIGPGTVETAVNAAVGILPVPRGPLELFTGTGAGLTLRELTARLSNLTGVTYSMSDSTGKRMSKDLVTLSQDKPIPAAEVYPSVESILHQNGYMLAILEGGPAALVGVYWKAEPGRNAPSFKLDAAHLEECRVHPATFFTTVLTLPDTDVRSVGNSLRILSPDSQTGGVVPVGMTSSVILSGTGREVADLAALLLKVKADARLGKPALAPVAAPATR